MTVGKGWVSFLLGGWLVLAGHAQVLESNVWINPGSGFWHEPLNWSDGFTPGTDYRQTIIDNPNTKTVILDSGIQNPDLVINEFKISAPAGFQNTLVISNLGVARPLRVQYHLTAGPGGRIIVTNSALRVEGATLGQFFISNGVVRLNGGLIETVGTIMRVGRGDAGTLIVNSGTVLVDTNLQVGASTNGAGILRVNGGTVSVRRKFDVADDAGSRGDVSVAGGTLLATNPLVNATIGDQGIGTLTISTNGLVRLSDVDIGRNINSHGTVTLAAGKFEVLGRLTVADDRGSTGVVMVLGGELIATNRVIGARIGDDGIGSLIVSNGLVRLGDASVGRDNTNGHGTLILAGGTIRCDDISVGRDGARGTVLVNGGQFLLGGDVFRIGRDSRGDMTVAGGLVRAKGMRIGISNDALGSLTVDAGSVLLSDDLILGNRTLTTNNPTGFTNATGTLVVNGGIVAITNAEALAALEMRYGTATINGGQVIMNQLLLTNTAGVLVFNGGILSTIDILANNGLPVVVGDGVNSATLELRGGTARVPGGLIIANNARIIGCGRIVGPVTVQPGGEDALVRCAPGPPTVVLISPRDGARLTTPATVDLSALASDPDGTVVRVEFFENGTLLHEDTTEPHEFTWSNLPVGDYAFTARATDDLGNMKTSTVVHVTVTYPPVGDLNVVLARDNFNQKTYGAGYPDGDEPVLDLNTTAEEGQCVVGSGPDFWWEIEFADPPLSALDPAQLLVRLDYRAENDWLGTLTAEYWTAAASPLASVALPVSSNALNRFTWDLSSIVRTRARAAAGRVRVINASDNGKKVSVAYARQQYETPSTNPPVIIPPIVITNTALLAGDLRFFFTSSNNVTYRVECSTNLADAWQWLTNITATGPLTGITNSAAPPRRFYRIRGP